MTEPEPDDRELNPEQEAQVRRLLADARHTEPTPDLVLARLDRVLADLAGEPVRSATVVRLADRRRRAATMLVAAAASVAAVIGVGQIVSTTGGEDAASPSSEAAQDVEEPEGASGSGSLPGSNIITDGGAAYDLSGKRMPFFLEADEFARDAAVLKSQASTLSGDVDGDQETDSVGPESAREELDRVRNRSVCDPGAWGGGGYVAVLYDGAEGWVVLRRPHGDIQIADLFLCGSESVVRSVTLPHP